LFYFVFVGTFVRHDGRRKRSYAQLATDDQGAPYPFPVDGGSKSSSRALSNSTLTVHKDGAYMQVSGSTFG